MVEAKEASEVLAIIATAVVGLWIVWHAFLGFMIIREEIKKKKSRIRVKRNGVWQDYNKVKGDK